MSRYRNYIIAFTVTILLAGCATTSKLPYTRSENNGTTTTALDRYVHAPDPNYSYELVNTIPGDGYTTYVLKMTSQKWLTEKEVDNPIWWHWMTLVRPDELLSDKGFLMIGGGSSGSSAPTGADALLVGFAMGTGTVATELSMVPNQPLVFADGVRRTEDSLIAYTWDKYFRTGDDKWPARLPMTKSAVRAMDTITDFTASEAGGGEAVNHFVVAGASKRGWTTWTTAAVDDRVIAIAPIVIDMLNIQPSFKHHYEVYGRYANAVADYTVMGIMEWQGTQEYQDLMEIVEPYEYRERFHIPKYILNATGDQFFIPDSWQFYWDDLMGEKYIRYVPNTDHGMGGSDVGESALAWYHSIVHNVPRPRFSWRVDEDGTIRVKAIDQPTEVRLWVANNPEERNFQLRKIGKAWTSTIVPAEEGGLYIAKVAGNKEGWSAYFLELTYPSPSGVPFKFTTGVKVTPDIKMHKFRYATDEEREPKTQE